MNFTVDNVISVLLALILHGVVIVLLLMNWEETAAIEQPDIMPLYIDAMVVDENPLRAKEREEAADAAARAEQLRLQRQRAQQEEARQARLRQEAIEKARQQELEAALAAKKAAEEAARKKAEEEGRDLAAEEEAERLRMEQSLALAIVEEQEYRRAVTDDEKAMAYVAQIQREIIQNWSRPPSARNGMEALLRVYLVPTGEVVDVVVEDGSGNDAFDRSALLAVQKAERFQVPPDPRQFERNFREFTVLFRPEDLRQ